MDIFYFVDDGGNFLRSSYDNTGEGTLVGSAPTGPNQTWDFASDSWKDIDNKILDWQKVKVIQRQKIVAYQDMMEIHEREVAHTDTDEADYTISIAKYQEFLTYFQNVRKNDEATHTTPTKALTALALLEAPSLD